MGIKKNKKKKKKIYSYLNLNQQKIFVRDMLKMSQYNINKRRLDVQLACCSRKMRLSGERSDSSRLKMVFEFFESESGPFSRG